jgi:putative transposase
MNPNRQGEPRSEAVGRPERSTLRHDNGLVFGSRLYRALARDYGLKQEYITPYTK